MLCVAGSIVAARMRTMTTRLSRRYLLAASAMSIAAVALFRSVSAQTPAAAAAQPPSPSPSRPSRSR